MKKILIPLITLGMMLAFPQGAQAQAFLNKMKEKAQSAVSNAVGSALEGTKVGNMMDKAKTTASQVTAVAEEAEDANSRMMSAASTSGSDLIQSKRYRNSSYDLAGVVPSKADKPAQLLNELPAIPTAKQLANPNQDEINAYYRQIAAVAMRAQQLNDDSETACDEAQMKLQDEKIRQSLMSQYGLTAAEVAIFEDENASEADKERVAMKMLESAMGPGAMQNLSMLGDMENMSDEEIQKMMQQQMSGSQDAILNAMFKVYDRHPSEVKEYSGMSVEEVKKYARESFAEAHAAAAAGKHDVDDAQGAALQAKMMAYRKQQAAVKGKDWMKKAEAFDKKMQEEIQAEMMSAMQSSSPFGALIGMAQAAQQPQQNQLQDLSTKMGKYMVNIDAMIPAASTNDLEFAQAEAKKLNGLKKQIYETDDAAVYGPLFQQAKQSVDSYRERSAAIWRADLQRRLDAAKAELPGLIKNRREGIAEGLLPECALWRAPLNLVVAICDLMEEAYSEFPCNYPSMYRREVVQTIAMPASAAYPECPSTNSLQEVLSGNNLYVRNNNGDFQQYSNGKWVAAQWPKAQQKNYRRQESATWTTSDGRKVIYDAQTGCLMLPEGDIIYPMAFEKQGNTLVWAIQESEGSTVKIVKCLYKL